MQLRAATLPSSLGAAAHLEAGALACARLLLHGHNLHDLILQGRAQEEVHNLQHDRRAQQAQQAQRQVAAGG
jgi:hypothetical protein